MRCQVGFCPAGRGPSSSQFGRGRCRLDSRVDDNRQVTEGAEDWTRRRAGHRVAYLGEPSGAKCLGTAGLGARRSSRLVERAESSGATPAMTREQDRRLVEHSFWSGRTPDGRVVAGKHGRSERRSPPLCLPLLRGAAHEHFRRSRPVAAVPDAHQARPVARDGTAPTASTSPWTPTRTRRASTRRERASRSWRWRRSARRGPLAC